MSKAYYNEHDPKKAAWIRELIKAELIAPGDVDERSIEDVLPIELAGYTQCHFFAGIAVWSYALRCAGWPDGRPVWTGSCPCQPFSQAGEGKGFADERHLWPAWFHLIQQCRPDVVFGEQVESKDGRTWLDLVQADLEASSYAIGPVGLCAAGFGAPHIRGRIFFVADAAGKRYDGRRAGEASGWTGESERSRDTGSLANPNGAEWRPPSERRSNDGDGTNARRQETAGGFKLRGDAGQLADPLPAGRAERRAESGNGQIAGSGGAGELGNSSLNRSRTFNGQSREGVRREEPAGGSGISAGGMGNTSGAGLSLRQPEELCGARRREEGRAIAQPGPTNGFWRNAEWLYCRDEKYRAVEPGTFPLADGVAARVGRLRGYGDAIVAQVAEEFIRAYLGVKEVA